VSAFPQYNEMVSVLFSGADTHAQARTKNTGVYPSENHTSVHSTRREVGDK